jgi:predicted metal-binding membrane protein
VQAALIVLATATPPGGVLHLPAGVASVVWMALLTALMVHEKTQPSGRRAVPVTGVALLATESVVLLPPAYANGGL